MYKIIYKLKALCRCQKAVAAMEFAFMLPILLSLLLGGVEVSSYLLVQQKTDKMSNTIADVIAQSKTVSQANINQLFGAAVDIMKPYTFRNNDLIIITSVSKNGNNFERVDWQRRSNTTSPMTSKIGYTGSTANLPGGLTLNDKETIIIAEVYYAYSPIISSTIIGNTEIYTQATYKPRLGSLSNSPT